MPFFGPKRHRHSRTLSVHSPPTTWSRLFGRLRERSVLVRILLCLATIILLLIGVQSWNAPFPYREGQRVAHGIAAKTKFSVVNEAETKRLRDNARARAPFVFENHPELLQTLVPDFRAALEAVQKAKSIDDLPEHTQRAFGLIPRSNESDAPVASAADSEHTFDQLKAAIAQTGQEAPLDRINELVHDFDTFYRPSKGDGGNLSGGRPQTRNPAGESHPCASAHGSEYAALRRRGGAGCFPSRCRTGSPA